MVILITSTELLYSSRSIAVSSEGEADARCAGEYHLCLPATEIGYAGNTIMDEEGEGEGGQRGRQDGVCGSIVGEIED